MKYFYLLILPILLLISACTNESGARMGLFTATAPVYAILHDDLFTGETVGYLDRSGTIDIQSAIDPEIKCVGEFHYTGTKNNERIKVFDADISSSNILASSSDERYVNAIFAPC